VSAIYVPSMISDIRGLAVRLSGPQPVGTRPNHLTAGRVSFTDSGRTTRVGHIVPFSCTNLQLLFGNHYVGGWGETPNTDDINVKAAIEYPLGTILPVFFNGARTVNLQGGCLVKSDPLGITVQAGVTGTCTDAAATTTSFTTSLTGAANNAYGGQIIQFTSGANAGVQRYITQTGFNTATGAVTVDVAFPSAPANGDAFKIIPVVYSRCYVSVTGTKQIPVGIGLLGGGSSSPFEGSTTGSDLVDSGTPGSSVINNYSAVALLGQPTAGVVPCIALGGDSIMQGTGDPDSNTGNYNGFGVRALNNQFPFVQLAKSAEQTIHFQNLNGNTRVRRMAIASGCTHAIFNYGTNDLGVRTAAQIEANILEITAALNAKGMKVFWCTLIPKTSSTNGWTDVAGQTKTGNESVRLAVNAWLRDTSANGYVAQAGGSSKAGVFDVASAVEVNASNVLTQDGGYWKAVAASASGTSSGSNTTTTLNDTSKNWTVNQFVGQYVYITGGTGAGQTAGYIVSNTATQLTIKSAWPTATPDATSTYVIANSYTIDGVHPTVNGHAAMAGAINTALFTV